MLVRADNDGEGVILALMSLLGVKQGRRPAIIAVGMLGAALLFGDGAITPAGLRWSHAFVELTKLARIRDIWHIQ